MKIKNLAKDINVYGANGVCDYALNYRNLDSDIKGLKFNHDYFKRQYEKGKHLKALKRWFKYNAGYELNLDNPKTFCEKLQGIKIFDNHDNKLQFVDKLKAKVSVANIIGEEHILPYIKVWNNAHEFDVLKTHITYYVKCNHGSQFNLSYFDNKFSTAYGKILNIKEAEKFFKNRLSLNYAYCGCYEMQYNNIIPKLYAEEIIYYNNDLGNEHELYCVNGEVKYITKVLFNNNISCPVVFDSNGKLQPWSFFKIHDSNGKYLKANKHLLKPSIHLPKMIEIAERLSKNFRFVRVDLRPYKDKIYFVELTFTPHSGIYNDLSYETDLQLGNMIKI